MPSTVFEKCMLFFSSIGQSWGGEVVFGFFVFSSILSFGSFCSHIPIKRITKGFSIFGLILPTFKTIMQQRSKAAKQDELSRRWSLQATMWHSSFCAVTTPSVLHQTRVTLTWQINLLGKMGILLIVPLSSQTLLMFPSLMQPYAQLILLN